MNWDKHCKRWLARVYEPTKDGKKGKEHKVGYYDDEEEAGRAIIARRKELGLPEKSTRKKREKKTGTGTVAAAAAAGAAASLATIGVGGGGGGSGAGAVEASVNFDGLVDLGAVEAMTVGGALGVPPPRSRH